MNTILGVILTRKIAIFEISIERVANKSALENRPIRISKQTKKRILFPEKNSDSKRKRENNRTEQNKTEKTKNEKKDWN